MKIYNQYYNSYGDEYFEGYYISEELAIAMRSRPYILVDPNDEKWVIEEIEVLE